LFGYQLGFHRVTDGIDIARFLSRADVDWDALTAHVARVGLRRETDAALATITELFGAPLPSQFNIPADAQRYVEKALQTRESRLLGWQAKQRQRVERLWHDHRFVYRSDMRKTHPTITRTGLWALRVRRLPFLISHVVSIALLQVATTLQRAFRSH
jgi:hypothetical protein